MIKNKSSKRQNPLKIIIPIVIILAGLAIAFYPIIGRLQNQIKANAVIDKYNQTISNMSSEDKQTLKDKADEYNRTGDSEYYVAINPDGVLGYIEIPSIDVYLPIYDNTETDTLDGGVGHVVETSLPVGGNGTHCLLTGHSGLTTQKMFTDLTELSEGDKFYLHVLGETLCYEVYETEKVLPSEVKDNLEYDKDKDLCTLMTCVPIGVNTHRLLVHGQRVDDTDKQSEETESTLTSENRGQDSTRVEDKSTLIDKESDEIVKITCYVVCGIVLFTAVMVILTKIVKKRKAKKEQI